MPLSVGFGILAFAPLGDRYLPAGIVAGLYGAIFLGLVAIVCGACTVAVYAPRSLVAFMIASVAMHTIAESDSPLLSGGDPFTLVSALLLTLAMAGLIQFLFGVIGLGSLMKFIPSPVMAGFQNAAAILILYSQLHVMLGLPARLRPLEYLQIPISDVRKNSEDFALMLEWFDRMGYDADIAGLEQEFGVKMLSLEAWARKQA